MHLVVNIITYMASLSYLDHLIIDVYIVADSPSVSHMQQKISCLIESRNDKPCSSD